MQLVVGLGSARGVAAAAVVALLDGVLHAHGLDAGDVRAYASIDRRAGEPGLLAAIAPARLRTYPAAALDAVDVPNPSERVRAVAATRSVAEAAALAGARELAGSTGARVFLLVPKSVGERVTVAVAALLDAPC